MNDKFNEWAKEEFGVSDEQFRCNHGGYFLGSCMQCKIDHGVVTKLKTAKAAWIAATKAAGEK